MPVWVPCDVVRSAVRTDPGTGFRGRRKKRLDSRTVAYYISCVMQRQAVARARPKVIPEFRRDLRVLEREIVRQLEGETACCAVTLPQCHVLLELSFGDLSLSGLATALDLDKSTLSRTVDSLVRAGLVDRTVDPADRRAVRLTLTPPGRERVATIDGTCNRYYADVLQPLSATERRQVVRAVRLLAEGMRRLRSAEPVAARCCPPEASTSSSVPLAKARRERAATGKGA
jgi:DNA-binding MarR family transcriptional regulator